MMMLARVTVLSVGAAAELHLWHFSHRQNIWYPLFVRYYYVKHILHFIGIGS